MEEGFMKIYVEPQVMIRLMTIATLYPKEFSGFGYVKLEKDVVRVYDFVLLDIGNETFTEIPTHKLMQLMDDPKYPDMKAWLHRHPMGSGVPGRENWSGMDENTIQTNPLGGVPELVKWSTSMVLTPRGWVGRIDNHLAKTTVHLAVEPQSPEAYSMLEKVKVDRPSVKSFPTFYFRPIPTFQNLKPQTPEATVDQASGRSEVESLFDGLDEIKQDLIEIGEKLAEAAEKLQERTDDLYTQVDGMIQGYEQDGLFEQLEGLDEEYAGQPPLQFRGVSR
jgi:hypothetical protein